MPSRKKLLASGIHWSSHPEPLHAAPADAAPLLPFPGAPAGHLGLSAAEVDALTLSTLSADAQPALAFPVEIAALPLAWSSSAASPLRAFAHLSVTGMSTSASSSPTPSASAAAPGSGREGSLKHRILSRPPGQAPDAPQSGHSTPMVSPAPSHSSSHSDPERTPPVPLIAEPRPDPMPAKKRARMTNFLPTPSPTLQLPVSSDCSMSGGSGSEMSTPCVSPKGPASPSPNKFCPGSLIQLANGQLKAVENMTVEDFELSAALSSSLRVEYSIVSRIEKSPLGHLRAGGGGGGEKKEDADVVIYFRVGHLSAEVAVEATTAHPFFVVGKGWSSAAPASTLTRFGLKVALLVAGDTCISLACRDAGQSSKHVTDENTLAAASASSAVRGPAGLASAPSRPEAVIITKVDARTTFPFQYGPAPATGEPPPASSHSGVPPLLFTATESELASFRRWSAPEDDRLLETFLAHHSHIPK